MGLLNQIEADLKDALRRREQLRLSVLRMLFASIHNREIEKRTKTGSSGLDDEEILGVLRQELKKRKDAAEGFEKGGRSDSAAKEREEAHIIQAYLPQEISDEELERVVRGVISGLGAVIGKDFGKVMGEVMKRAKGLAAGDRASALVKKLLEK